MRFKTTKVTILLLWLMNMGFSLALDRNKKALSGIGKNQDVSPYKETKIGDSSAHNNTVEELKIIRRKAQNSNRIGRYDERNKKFRVSKFKKYRTYLYRSKCNDGGHGIREGCPPETLIPPKISVSKERKPYAKNRIGRLRSETTLREKNAKLRFKASKAITKEGITPNRKLYAESKDVFDLEACGTYDTIWAEDLRISCSNECRCYDAERRLANGEISCRAGHIVNQCPGDCAVCNHCLGTVLGNYCSKIEPISEKFESVKTNLSTSSISPHINALPNHAPTSVSLVDTNTFLSSNPSSRTLVSPTSKPTCDDSSMPTMTLVPTAMPVPDDFDLSICETYEEEWAQNLRATCLKDKCICFDAERRLKFGELSCEGGPLVNGCPENCDACMFCLDKVLGGYCDSVTSRPSVNPTDTPSSIPSALPSRIMSFEPSIHPTESTNTPSTMRSAQPSRKTSFEPSIHPTTESTGAPTTMPSIPPSRTMSFEPSIHPTESTNSPTTIPSERPSRLMSFDASVHPSVSPSLTSTFVPTSVPSINLDSSPSSSPSLHPMFRSSSLPTDVDSSLPTTIPPPDSFDIDICETYEIEWAQDLRGTCLLDTNCICSDAEKRLKLGEISCTDGPLVNHCPEDCEVCKFCLGVVLRGICDSGASHPSDFPSWLPSNAPIAPPSSMPSSRPTPYQSGLPSFGPTLLKTSDPTETPTPSQFFDLSRCQDYEMQWVTDVIIDGFCDSTQNLISEGLIDCKVALCPDHCVMCKFCLESFNCSPELTRVPSWAPIMVESLSPSDTATLEPSSQPSSVPSRKLTRSPSFGPTIIKSDTPTSYPTPTPTVGFDLSDCRAYSNDWMSDIIITGACKGAKENIDKKLITCGLDRCPFQCGICNFCLSSLDCEQGAEPPEQSLPTSNPTTPPSIVQTDTFDLSNCNMYSIDWLFDLARSCERNPTIDVTEGCRCYDAEEKIRNGFITCGVDKCPEGCSACEYCLFNVLDCRPEPASSQI